MKSLRGHSWTAEDDKKLIALANSGATAFRAAAAFRTPRQSVTKRAKELGVKLKSPQEVRQSLKIDHTQPPKVDGRADRISQSRIC